MKTLNRSSRAGFTLIEIMIVIAIILLLAGVAAIALLGQQKTAKVNICKIEMKQVASAIELFHLNFERFPTEQEGLAVLWNKELLDPESDPAKWAEYLREPKPVDPWGQPWGYRPESEEPGREGKYDLWSYGPDKEDGTEDDVKNWSSAEDSESMGGDLPPPPSGG